jgi:hypothetical protein
MTRVTWRILATVTIAATSLGVVLPATPAAAHEERDTVMPDGTGSVPEYRRDGPTLLVCKTDKTDFEARIASFKPELRTMNLSLWTQCQESGYRHLQDAVDAVKQPGMNIKILPGVYLEEPSHEPPSAFCADLPARRAALGYQVLTWEQQLACPNTESSPSSTRRTCRSRNGRRAGTWS